MSLTFSSLSLLKIGSVCIVFAEAKNSTNFFSVILQFYHIYSPKQECKNLSKTIHKRAMDM